jgi:hypothetical protein
MKTIIITIIFICSIISVPFSQTIDSTNDSIKKPTKINLKTIIKPTFAFPAIVSFKNRNYGIGILQTGADVAGVVFIGLGVYCLFGSPGYHSYPPAFFAGPSCFADGVGIPVANRLISVPVNLLLTNEYNQNITKIGSKPEKGFITIFKNPIISRRHLGVYYNIISDELVPWGVSLRIARNTFFFEYTPGGSGYWSTGGTEEISGKELYTCQRDIKGMRWEYMILGGRIFELTSGLKYVNCVQDYVWLGGGGNGIPEKHNIPYNYIGMLIGGNCYFTNSCYLNLNMGFGYSIDDYLLHHNDSWGNTMHWDLDKPYWPSMEMKILYWF